MKKNRIGSMASVTTVRSLPIAGVPQIHFHREAPSLEEAISSALVNLKKAGFDVIRVEIEPGVVQGTQPFQAEQRLHDTTT